MLLHYIIYVLAALCQYNYIVPSSYVFFVTRVTNTLSNLNLFNNYYQIKLEFVKNNTNNNSYLIYVRRLSPQELCY